MDEGELKIMKLKAEMFDLQIQHGKIKDELKKKANELNLLIQKDQRERNSVEK